VRNGEAGALFKRYRETGDQLARERLVRFHMPLARQLAGRYARGLEPFDDLFQVACLGLIKAVDRYDPERGTSFPSYAVPTITGELKRHFRDKTWVVRVPHSVHDVALRVRAATEGLAPGLGRAGSVRALADALGAREEEVCRGLEALAAYEVGSLEAPCDAADGTTLGDALGDDDAGYHRVEERAEIDALLGCLTARERDVLRLRFDYDLTQQEIAERLQMSQMAVSRLLRRCLPRLRQLAEARGIRAA
jgi:RNA polymerase sigma-B factor